MASCLIYLFSGIINMHKKLQWTIGTLQTIKIKSDKQDNKAGNVYQIVLNDVMSHPNNRL